MNEEKSFIEILSLCLRSRCPVCKNGRLFVPFYQAKSFAHLILPQRNCNQCGFQFGREPGYYLGVLTPTLPILSLATGLVFVIGNYVFFRPENPHDLIPIGAVGAAVGFTLFWRTSIAIFMSFDHAICPPEWPQDAPSTQDKTPERRL